jgi:hypothetical protein
MFRQRPYRHVFFGLTARNDVRIASNRRAIDAYVGVIVPPAALSVVRRSSWTPLGHVGDVYLLY